ncbi:DUF6683 family protein [Edaphobacter flagellatus]|uniref:DUF6683 family protein n=1 Tax=Edaphobacter flagellatus TaxID=1933044 RepID=UPI0021B27CF9|nr:DUF6683 family protein [Edaphobacter flagellatus]
MRSLTPHLCALALLAALSLSCHAQFAPVDNMAVMNLNNSQGLQMINNMQRSFDSQNEASRRAGASPRSSPQTASQFAGGASLDDAAWAVGRNPGLSRQVRDEVIGNLARSKGEPAARKVDAYLGDIQTTFHKMVAPYGLRNDNLIDVLTAYMVVMWMSANRQTALPSVAQVQGARQQLRGIYAQPGHEIADASQRQLMAEDVMYQTCMAVATREEAVSHRRPELLDTLATQARASTANAGLDMQRLQLTNRGFVSP